MEQTEEHVDVAADAGDGALGEGQRRKRRRRRRSKGREGQPDTGAQNEGPGGDDDGDDADGVADQDEREARPTDGDDPGPAKKKRRRKKKKRGDGQPADPTGAADTDDDGDDDDAPAEGTASPAGVPASTAGSDQPRRNGGQQQREKRERKDRGRDREKKEPPTRGSILQRRMVRLDGPREELLAEPIVPVMAPVNATTVEAYVSQHRGWQREVLMKLRDMVRNAVPGVEESIKWAQPVYEIDGPMCYMKAFSSHVNFGFWRGTELSDPDHLLEGDGLKMRHVKITSLNDIRREAFEGFLRQAARLNKEKGDPTSF